MIYKWMDDGKFSAVKIGNISRVKRDESEACWKKGKGISMALIRENGKFNVIYNYMMIPVNGEKWETYDTKSRSKEAKKRNRI